MDQFSVAIVGGTGNLGGALALRLGAPGVRIIIGSRDEAKAKNAVDTLKQNCAPAKCSVRPIKRRSKAPTSW